MYSNNLHLSIKIFNKSFKLDIDNFLSLLFNNVLFDAFHFITDESDIANL